MAYIGYDTRARIAARPAIPNRMAPPLAWGRLAIVAVNVAAWVGIIAAARAIF